MEKVLVVIDMQNDFIDGSLGSKDATSIVPRVKDKIKMYSDNNLPVYFTQDTHFGDYLDTFEGKNLPVPHCIYKQHGWKISDKIGYVDESSKHTYYINPDNHAFVETDVDREHKFNVIFKDRFGTLDWFSNRKFMEDAGIEKIVVRHEFHKEDLFHDHYGYFGGSIEIVGLCTDICVVTNALILRTLFPNTEIVVDANYCAGTSKEKHEAALLVMESCQIKVNR